MSKTITITGAAGQIGYQLAFRIASGQLLGVDEKINLNLLEITPALDALMVWLWNWRTVHSLH